MQIVGHKVQVVIAANDDTPEGVEIYVVFDVVENELKFRRKEGKKDEVLFTCSGCEANSIATFLQGVAGNAPPPPLQPAEPRWEINTSNVDCSAPDMVATYTGSDPR